MATDFDELRRMAYRRGMSDYERYEQNRLPGEPVWRNNPYQNNYATDERENWDWGYDEAKRMHEEENGS